MNHLFFSFCIPVHSLPNLTVLSLSGCSKVTDDGVELIAENLSRLRSLDLSWCSRITDAALEYIACDLNHLEELTLDRWELIIRGQITVLFLCIALFLNRVREIVAWSTIVVCLDHGESVRSIHVLNTEHVNERFYLRSTIMQCQDESAIVNAFRCLKTVFPISSIQIYICLCMLNNIRLYLMQL